MKKTKFVSISSSKGGVGKSTITSLFATGLLSHFGLNVAIVDIDPQESLIQARMSELKEIELNPPKANSSIYQTILKNREKSKQSYPDVFRISLYDDFPIIKSKLQTFVGKYDLIFLDFPGSLNIHTNTLLLLKELDYIFIPFYVDQNNSNSTFKFVNALKELKGKKLIKADFYMFFNRYNGEKGKNGNLFEDARNVLLKNNYPLLNNVIYESSEVERYSTIIPLKPSASRKNTYHLLEEVKNIINK